MGWTLAKPCSQPGMLWIDVNAKIAKTNKRGLASSVRAEQPCTVPTGTLKVHANESLGLTERLADASTSIMAPEVGKLVLVLMRSLRSSSRVLRAWTRWQSRSNIRSG